MDNPTRWNITNSAQNIVSALVDPSKQFDHVFRREWTSTFAGSNKHKSVPKQDTELKLKLKEYVSKLDNRRSIKSSNTRGESPQEQLAEIRCDIVVPEIFMRDNFDLSDSETFFRIISLGKETDSTVGNFLMQSPQSFTESRLKELQQRLTDFLDVIEEQLANQISSRSGDFFQVMSSVDSVMDELSLAIKSVTQLRKKCAKLNDNVMLPNMESIHLSKVRDNAHSALDKLNEISHLCKVQPMIQILLSASDFVGALDLISKSRIMLHKDLTNVVSLRHLESQLNEIERMIGTMMQQEFLTLISSEWDGSQTFAASRLSKLFDYFANGPSEIPDRGSLTLLSLLQIQAEKFVNQFHEERKRRVESALDIEQWKITEVPRDFQRLIKIILDEKLKISELFSGENQQTFSQDDGLSQSSSNLSISSYPNNNSQDYKSVSKLAQLESNANGSSSDNLMGLVSTRQKSRMSNIHVQAAGTEFVVVNSVIILIRTVMDYCKCAHDIRSLSADLLERLFKILQLYNSKTYHLVYSAGAIQAAGLKTITTRSLIVSQRCLELIILIIPAMHQHFFELLPNDKRLRRFDEIESLYKEHVTKIPERVVSIVKDIINLHLQDWEAKPPVPSTQFNSVAQHFIRLHDNIQDTLPHTELVLLFKKISKSFLEVLMVHLRRLNISNDAGPQQWLVMQELTFYKISLSKLKPFQDIIFDFDDLWSGLESEIESCDNTKNKSID